MNPYIGLPPWVCLVFLRLCFEGRGAWNGNEETRPKDGDIFYQPFFRPLGDEKSQYLVTPKGTKKNPNQKPQASGRSLVVNLANQMVGFEKRVFKGRGVN